MEAHGEDLREVGGDEALVAALKRGDGSARLSPRERAIVVLAVEVTQRASAITRARLDAARAAGLSDEDLLNVVQVTGFFNYYNRMADALGVEPEDFMPPRPPRTPAPR